MKNYRLTSTSTVTRSGEFSHLYAFSRWRSLRKRQLASEPLCRICVGAGIFTVATVCDHIEPHRGDMKKFWAGPFQSLCKQCHDSDKKAMEKSGSESTKFDAKGRVIW